MVGSCLRHVLWIGGPPASGKTTIATALARRFGMRLYSSDTRTWDHRDRALKAGNAAARRWESQTPIERWEHPTSTELLEMSLHRERGPMVVDDSQALPTSPLIVAEGSTLPASALSSGVAMRSRAVWLIPTADFQEAQLAARQTADGQARLYRLLGREIEREARDHDVPTLRVDGSREISEMLQEVVQMFGHAIAWGPPAATLVERQHLLREMNQAVVAQIRAYHARPWADGNADDAIRSFVCECGDPKCSAELSLSVHDASIGRAIAPDHGVDLP